jgi:hypothetical protein
VAFCGLQSGDGKKEINNSYWDTQTSGITESDGGEGKTTAEMMMQSTFVDWDFDNVWCMGEHETYPQLQYFVDCDTVVSVPDTELNSEIILYQIPLTTLCIYHSIPGLFILRKSLYTTSSVR